MDPSSYPPPYPYPPRPPARTGFPSAVLLMLLGAVTALVLYRYVFDRGKPAVEPRPVMARGELAPAEKTVIEVFRESSRSVVHITTATQRLDLFTLNVQEIPQGTGSGFIWDDAGHVVTNFHVVQSASSATVALHDQETYAARVVGVAPGFDLAVLRINAPRDKLRPIPIGTSADLHVGQSTFAIGNPFGLDQTLTTGIVSALGRTIRAMNNQPIEDVIQTDAAINPGNSGGPLLDSAGRLIGVNTAIYSPSGAYAGIGFAVPVDTVNRVVPQLIQRGKVASPSIGIVMDDRLGQRLTRRLGIEGVLVLGIRPNSPAEAAGLRGTRRTGDGYIPGDIITHVDDRRVRSAEQLQAALSRRKPGETVTITVQRGDQTLRLPVRVGEGE